jgi:hypothetical protein
MTLTALAFVGEFTHKFVSSHTPGKRDVHISLSPTLTALAFVTVFIFSGDGYTHTCELHPKAMRDSVKKSVWVSNLQKLCQFCY